MGKPNVMIGEKPSASENTGLFARLRESFAGLDRLYLWSAVASLMVAAALIELAIAIQNRSHPW